MHARIPRAWILGFLVLAGCGGDGSNIIDPGNPPGGSGGALTAAERMEAIAAVESRIEALSQEADSPEALNQALAEWFAGRTEFEAAGVDSTSSVWARFRDGRLLIVANNREPAEAGDSALAATAPASPGPQMAIAGASELPQRSVVRLLHSFGANFDGQAPINDLSDWFSAAGYVPAAGVEGDAGVERLRLVSGDAFFYLNTHGGRGRTRGDQGVYAVQTSTLVSGAVDAQPVYEDDLENGRLVYMTARNGGKILGGLVDDWDTRYAITYRFVEEYMSFGKNSIVYINACFSASDHSDISSFIFAMHKKGASVYLGWKGLLNSGAAYSRVRYFVDRLLGGNRYQPEDPRQRPFDWSRVMDDMQRKGLTIDGVTGAELIARPAAINGQMVGPLAPSIAMLYVAEETSELHISGIFGSDPGAEGSVSVVGGSGEVALAISQWTPDLIIASIPRTGPGSAGDVVVTVRGHRSNARRLVSWTGTLRYTLQDKGTLRIRIEADIDSRADPDLFRQEPGTQPDTNPLALLTSGSTVGPSLRYVADGELRETNGDCTYTTVWSGSGEIPWGGASTEMYFYQGQFDAASKQLSLTLLLAGTPITDTFIVQCAGSGTYTDAKPRSLEIAAEVFDGALSNQLIFQLDPTFGIVGERRQRTTYSRIAGSDPATATLEWSLIPAKPAFDQAQAK